MRGGLSRQTLSFFICVATTSLIQRSCANWWFLLIGDTSSQLVLSHFSGARCFCILENVTITVHLLMFIGLKNEFVDALNSDVWCPTIFSFLATVTKLRDNLCRKGVFICTMILFYWINEAMVLHTHTHYPTRLMACLLICLGKYHFESHNLQLMLWKSCVESAFG